MAPLPWSPSAAWAGEGLTRGGVASAYVKGERDAPAPASRRSPRFPVPSGGRPQRLLRGRRGSGLALFRQRRRGRCGGSNYLRRPPAPPRPAGRAFLPLPFPTTGRRRKPFAVVSRAHGIRDIWALGSRTDPAEPAKGHGSPGGPHPRAADIPPPAAETAPGHGPLAAINNLWPAATPRGLASPWPGAWKYLFHEEAEELGVVGRVTAARASGAAVRDTLSLPTVVSEKQLFAGCPGASRLLALFIILWALLPSSCACYEK